MSMSQAVATISIPREIGPYRVLGSIGQGGMAMLYKAVRIGVAGFERPVVLKVMDPAQSAEPQMVELFKTEARVLSQLSHPNIVQVQDFGVCDGMFYLVMELLEGRDLLKILRASRGPLPVAATLRIARELCDGLGYIHSFSKDGIVQQIIHRDVSPANVMVCDDGAIKLLDFGVAKLLAEYELNFTMNLRGKFSYMAPEQLNGQPFDRRIDVFSTGVMLHEMLTGRRLFYRPQVEDTLKAIEELDLEPPSRSNKLVPAALDEVVMTALARDPSKRYASATLLGEALERVPAPHLGRRDFVALIAQATAHDPSAKVVTALPSLARPEAKLGPRPEAKSEPNVARKVEVDRQFALAPSEPSFGSRVTLRAIRAVRPADVDLEPEDFTAGHERFDFSEEPSPLPPVPTVKLPPPSSIPPLQRRAPRKGPLMLLYLLASALLLL